MKKMVDVCDKCKKILSLDEMKNEIYLDYRLPLILCNDCFAKTKIKHKAEEMANAYQKNKYFIRRNKKRNRKLG